MKVYKSKIDAWLFVVMLLGLLIAYVGILFDFSWKNLLIVSVMVLPAALLMLDLLAHCDYTITDDGMLKVRCGLIVRTSVKISDILSVKPTRTALSSPALSLDRLSIRTLSGSDIVISPKEKTAFVAHLKEINPGIIVF
jgi:Protein of unknown function (DUF1200).